MACREVTEGVLCQHASGDGVAWWDTGGGTVLQIPLGTLADWTTVLVAAVALFFAWRSNVTSHKLLRVEQKREDRAEELEAKRRDEAARAAQADHIAVWLDEDQTAGSVKWIVSNGGGLPIYDVTLQLVDPRSGAAVIEDHRPTITPEGRTRILTRPDFGHGKFLLAEAAWLPKWWLIYRPAVRFRDAANRKWIRDMDGVLKPDPEVAG